jgi:predicted esterase
MNMLKKIKLLKKAIKKTAPVLLLILGAGCSNTTVNANLNCEPNSIYGPRPCIDDQECVTENGDGWYCDQNNSFDDGCGGTTTWPVCDKR